VCVCAYARAHTHTVYGELGCEPKSRDETPEKPEESRWTESRHICIRICVQSMHVYICVAWCDEILHDMLFSLNLFLPEQEKHKM